MRRLEKIAKSCAMALLGGALAVSPFSSKANAVSMEEIEKEIRELSKSKEVESKSEKVEMGTYSVFKHEAEGIIKQGISKVNPLTKGDFGEKVKSEEIPEYLPLENGTKLVYNVTSPHGKRVLIYDVVVEPKEEKILSVRGDESISGNRKFDIEILERGDFVLGHGPFFEKSETGLLKLVPFIMWEDIEYAGQRFGEMEKFWTVEKNPYIVSRITTYDFGIPSAGPGSGIYGLFGFSSRIIFFGDSEVGAGLKSRNLKNEWCDDEIYFMGKKNYQDMDCLCFLRKVGAPKDIDLSELSKEEAFAVKPFEEETLFAKGKGLVYLEQRVDGETTMTWKLDKFTPGKK